MDYQRIFADAIERLHAEGRYRVFIDILRNKGSYPNARCFAGHNGPKPITVWCSNDYLAMGQHPKVVEAMEEALHNVGAGSGGTRNIGGNTHYHVDLEAELIHAYGHYHETYRKEDGRWRIASVHLKRLRVMQFSKEQQTGT